MLQKMTSHKTLAVLGLALALILGSGMTSVAQVRSEFTVNSLFEVSNPTPQVDETIEFEMNLRTVLFYNIHNRSILAVEWNFGDGTVMRGTTLDNKLYAYREAGEYEATLRIITPQLTFTASHDVTVEENFQPQFEQIEFGIVTITTFDTNGDNRLDDGEFFNAIDAWIEGSLNDDIFFLAVDIWVANDTIIATRNVESSSQNAYSASVQSTTFGYVFSAQGVNAQEIAVQIYSASGQPIYEAQNAGQTLSWRGLDSSGTPVANGTYFYVVRTLGADGQMHVSAPQAIAVVR